MDPIDLRIELCKFSKDALAMYIVKTQHPKKILIEMEKIELDLQLENVSQEMADVLKDMKMCEAIEHDGERAKALAKLHEAFDDSYKRHDTLMRLRFIG